MVKMTFDPEVSKVVGTDEAIIFSNIQYWVHKNRVNKKHCYHEMYWTYNSSKAFSLIFTWLSPSQIRRCLKKLESNGFIQVGNFNQNKFNRSMWYTDQMDVLISELPFDEIVKSDVTKSLNHTDNKPNNKPNNKQQIDKMKFCVPTIEEVSLFYQEKKFSKEESNLRGGIFWNHYDEKNWKVGKNKMKDWKRAVVGWLSREKLQNIKNKKVTSAETKISEYEYGTGKSWK